MGRGKRIGILFFIPVIILSVLLLNGCTKTQPKVVVDYEALADKLVNQCAQIREGDCVLVTGGVRDMELLENVAVHVRKVGAFPLVTVGSDRMIRKMHVEVPEKWDAQTSVVEEKLNHILTATISVEFREKSDLLADIPAKRLENRNQAYAPIIDSFIQKRIRGVNLGNGLYPTADLAKQFGMPLETLSKIFWDGVNVDYTKLKTICDAVQAALAMGQEIRITHANGTDLIFGIKGRIVFSSDGIIPPDDPKKKTPPAVWLPAGEVITTPIPGTAKGKVVIERNFYQGKEIKGMSLTFDGGKVVSMYGGTGGEKLLERYQSMGAGKELFGFVDIGTNPNVQIPAGSRMAAYMPSGAITIGIGRNDYYGGENTGSFGVDFFLPGYSLAVDGKILVENGVLKI
jgi:leucyl aminopeptidase (aminopeptidase T)